MGTYCCDEQSEARLHVVLFCFACPKILVIEDLFFKRKSEEGEGMWDRTVKGPNMARGGVNSLFKNLQTN